MKIFHITSVHPRYDTRIFLKECSSLAGAGYDVSLIVCDGNGDEESNGVKILDAGNCHGFKRIKRMIKGSSYIDKVLKNTIEDYSRTIIHFHDPELLFLGKKYARKGCKVIYDSHENVPAQILTKPYLNKYILQFISKIFENTEKNIVKELSAVISITEKNVERFSKSNDKAYLVRNFPILSYFNDVDFEKKELSFLYAGGISKIRGACEMAKAAYLTKTDIHFYGPVSSDSFKEGITNSYTFFHGSINPCELYEVNKLASVGFLLLYPTPNYVDGYPVKLFEYMLSGMAIISSRIPSWNGTEIIEKYQCGICVDPTNLDEICSAIEFMKNNAEMRNM